MGFAYYANYFVWFEVARCELLRALGGTYQEMEAGGVFLPVVEAHCDYRSPAHYDDDLDISTSGSLLSPARLEFRYDVRRKHNATLIATGLTVHAATDSSGKPRRLPLDLRVLLT